MRNLSGYGIGHRQHGESSKQYAARALEFCQEAMPTIGAQRKSTDWATQILDRYADGEAMPDLSVRWACEVAGVDEQALRATVRASR